MKDKRKCKEGSHRVALQKFQGDQERKDLLVQEGGRPIEKLLTELDCHLSNERTSLGRTRSKRVQKGKVAVLP